MISKSYRKIRSIKNTIPNYLINDKKIYIQKFNKKHIGPDNKQINKMLSFINFKSLNSMMDTIVPDNIKTKNKFIDLPNTKSEHETLSELKNIIDKNENFRSHIGLGYYNTITPSVIKRNIIENPGWYTSYTPYQSEISQGRLEMLFNYQTLICNLTSMPIANSGLLDEATAAAEAIFMVANNSKSKSKTILVSNTCHPQTIDVITTKSSPLNINIQIVDNNNFSYNKDISAIFLQYPNTYGNIEDYSLIVNNAKKHNIKIIVATDLLSLTLLEPPGKWGADIVIGSSQRFGVSMGYGGPHAAFFATTHEYKRKIPGKIVGLTKDMYNNPAFRLALQTREQHIKRQNATSNICTSQTLLANINASYAIYHGPEGLIHISSNIHKHALHLSNQLQNIGFIVKNKYFFDTVHIKSKYITSNFIIDKFIQHKINLRKINKFEFSISLDETTTKQHVLDIITILSDINKKYQFKNDNINHFYNISNSKFKRISPILKEPVFNNYNSETNILRYLYHLQSKDYSLTNGMIPLGSCTMKLNSTSEMIPITWDKTNIHPFAPINQTIGYQKIIHDIKLYLANILKLPHISLQPNSGAQGEYAGLMCIRKYFIYNNLSHRNICLIPDSAHGTNPASAVLAGMKVLPIKSDKYGNIDINHLYSLIHKHGKNIAACMITYPSTHGIYEKSIFHICNIIHKIGAFVYLDGANLNAQIGFTSPGEIGADVCHVNLHKTFAIPHGGGGPGLGPIAVNDKLKEFLPDHFFIPSHNNSIGAISAAPFSNASLLPITWMYIRLMGSYGLKKSTQVAILNANYILNRLKNHYDILYTDHNSLCAHEFIIDLRKYKKLANITEIDIAKRLQDYNFHAPTISWPVSGTIMIEPTESEDKNELDRFCDAMISIKKEINFIIDNNIDKNNNVIKNAPHTHQSLILNQNSNPNYSSKIAAYPLPYLINNKFWPSVSRVNDVYGDKNLICHGHKNLIF